MKAAVPAEVRRAWSGGFRFALQRPELWIVGAHHRDRRSAPASLVSAEADLEQKVSLPKFCRSPSEIWEQPGPGRDRTVGVGGRIPRVGVCAESV